MANGIDYDKFRLSLERLREQFENRRVSQGRVSQGRAPHEGLPVLMREAIDESVIQRFETCYDCLWKVLKRYLVEALGVVDPPNSPKPVFRLANENGLLASPLDRWLDYADLRTGTAHDYDGEKARQSLASVADFIADATTLYETMSGETWKRTAPST